VFAALKSLWERLMRSFHIRASQAGELDSSFRTGTSRRQIRCSLGDLSPIQAAITQTTVGTSVSVAVRTASRVLLRRHPRWACARRKALMRRRLGLPSRSTTLRSVRSRSAQVS